jgi:GNAT superfamily N-acetyltransferase
MTGGMAARPTWPAPLPVRSHGALVAAGAGDPFVRWMVDPRLPVRGWRLEPGVAWVRRNREGRPTVMVVADPARAAAALPGLLDRAGDDLRPGSDLRITVPLGTIDLLDGGLTRQVLPGEGADWEWMMTTTPPGRPGRGVVRLGGSDLPAVADLLARSSPRHSTSPTDEVVAWYGIRDGDRLVACAAHVEHISGVPQLASIAVHPEHRGRGHGSAVTAAATQGALDAGAQVVTLGLYADNDTARRMYTGLGFGETHRWSSRVMRDQE